MPDKIEDWLVELGLGRYVEQFANQEVDFEDLVDLDEDDLKELGIPLGPRKRILKAAAVLAKAGPSEVSVSMMPSNRLATWERHPDERKPATVLFADITGSTALTEHMDAEDTHDILDGVRQRMCLAVASHRGTVCRVMGDGMMAVFGAPIASEHHAVEACEAALAMQHAVFDYSAEIEAQHGCKLKIRVGLHSGEIVVLAGGDGDKVEYDADGPTVPIAARMEQAAEPGTVYMTAATQALADFRIETETIKPISVKGVSDPVPVFLLRRVRAAEEASVGTIQTSFVGRRSELNQFKGILDTCLEEKLGQTVYIRGEPGIGKTRLVEEYTQIARDRDFAIHRGLALPFGVGEGQDAIRSLVRSLIGVSARSVASVRQQAANTVVGDGRLKHEQVVFLNDLLDLPPPAEQRTLYDAMDNATRNEGKEQVVSKLVATTSADQPILAIIEDVHWADAITLSHLAALTKTVAGCPALLVMTSRIEGDPLDQSWRSTTEGSPFFTIDLGPLRIQDSIALISEFIDSTDPLAESCLERAAGNPLFLEQLLRAAREGSASSLPDSIQTLVLARMDRLEANHKQGLQAASVIGHRFDVEVLRHLLQWPDYDCDELVKHNLIRPEGKDYLFVHALIQESVYGSLLTRQRRDLHEKAAHWFADSDLVLHAEHLAHAKNERASIAFLNAAREQAEFYRLEKALSLVERGIDVSTDNQCFELQYLQGELYRSLGSTKESINVYRAAKETSTSDIDRCRASVGVSEGLRILGVHDELLEELVFAEAIAQSNKLSMELARIYQLRGGAYFLRGDTLACVEANKAALRYADATDSLEVKAQSLSGLGDAEYLRGRMITAQNYYDQCIDLSRERGFGKTLAANLTMRGAVLRWQNERASALRDFREALSLSEETGQTRAEMVALFAGECLAEWGEIDEGEQWLKRRLLLARRLGSRAFEGQSLTELGRIAYTRGCLDEAERLAQEGVATLRDGGMAFSGARALGVLALVTRDADQRRLALSEGEEVLKGNSLSHNFFQFYMHAMDTCIQMGEWEDVDRYAKALEDYTQSEPLPMTNFLVARGRALAAFGRGNRDESTMYTLRTLLVDAKRVGLCIVIPELEKAISSN